MDKLDLSKVNVQSLFTEDEIPGVPDEPAEGGQTPEGAEGAEGEQEDTEGQQSGAQTDQNQQDAEGGNANEGAEGGEGGDGEEEQTMFQVLQERLGYQIEGEFNEDYDGLVDFTKKVAEKLLEDQLNGIAQAFPDVAEYIAFRENGGDPKTFFQNMISEVDYETLEIKENDERTQIAVVSELLKNQGFSPAEIQEMVEDYKDANILFKQAAKAKPVLAKTQAKQRQETFQQQEQQRIEKERKVQEYWQNVQNAVQSGVVQGFVIPEADKRSFMEWMAKPVDKDGNTQRTLTRKQMGHEQMVALDYLIYKGFDLKKLVQNTKSTQQANNLRNRLNKSTSDASVRMKSGATTSARGVKLPGLKELF